MLRRFASQRAPPAQSNNNNSGLSRASTTTNTAPSTRPSSSYHGPTATPEFSSLSISDDPPPPPYLNPFDDPPQQAPIQPNQTVAPPQTQSVSRPAQVTETAAVGRGGTGGLQRQRSVEDPLSTLTKYDLVLLVDDSPSMHDLWDETGESLMALADKCVKYDKDGIDLYFMNHSAPFLNVTESGTVREAFETITPSGSTPTGYLLDEILRPYVESVEDAKATKTKVKPLILICLTDGRADDADLVKEVIIEMASRLDEVRAPSFQLGVQFIQLGSDPDAAAFLAELDDDLKAESNVRDIVDTTPYEGRLTSEFILKAFLGSVVKRLDNT